MENRLEEMLDRPSAEVMLEMILDAANRLAWEGSHV